jgi:uncharacterized membrane protein
MDAYSIFKFLHIAAAMAWVGGGVTIFAMAIFAERAKDDAELMRILGSIGILANRWFVPSSLLTLVFGIVMAFLGGLWGELWVILGLAGFAATFVTGHFVARVKAMKAGQLMGEGKLAEAAAVGRQLMQVAKFDYTMLFLVVADMVFKPHWTDYLTLGIFGAVLVVAAVIFLPGARNPAPQAA